MRTEDELERLARYAAFDSCADMIAAAEHMPDRGKAYKLLRRRAMLMEDTPLRAWFVSEIVRVLELEPAA